jgi:hypothetical protein
MLARPARLTAPEPEWFTVKEAARRLEMSRAWFRTFAKGETITVVRRGAKPGVDWTTVEALIARSRISMISGSLLCTPTWRQLPGVAVIDKVKTRFGWSDRDVADALGVWPSVVCRYRMTGVPDHQLRRLRELARTPPADVDPPRSRVPKRGVASLPFPPKRPSTGRSSPGPIGPSIPSTGD